MKLTIDGEAPAGIPAKYVEEVDGKIVFDLGEYEGGMKRKMEDLLAEKKEATASLETLRGKVTSLEADRESLRKDIEEGAQGEAKELQKTIGELQQQLEKAQADVESAKKEATHAEGTVKTYLIDNEARRELAAMGVGESSNLLLPHIRERMKVEKDGDKYVSRVIDPDTGNVRIADSQGTPLSVKGLLEEMKDLPDFKLAFNGSGASGSGASPGGRSGAGGAGKQATDASPQQKIAAGLGAK